MDAARGPSPAVFFQPLGAPLFDGVPFLDGGFLQLAPAMAGYGWPGQAMDGHCSPWLVMVGQHKPWLAPARHALSVVVRAGQGWLLLAMVGQGRPRLVIAGHEFHLCHPPDVQLCPWLSGLATAGQGRPWLAKAGRGWPLRATLCPWLSGPAMVGHRSPRFVRGS